MIIVKDLKCTECGMVEERYLTKSANLPSKMRLECKNCGHTTTQEVLMSAPRVNYSVFNAGAKLPTDFKNRMDQIRKNNPDMGGKYY